ncbi:(4Fe-4S)-binding protein [Deinococcus sp.]|uniref:(4Fe-4S)-binding protein n=1 Tax=Deinococcus sp. TaxID=47478 RepID=UPI003C7CD9B4
MTQPSGPETPAGPLRGKHYTSPEIVVSYDAPRCIHARACVEGLPQVFDPAVRPWIRPDQAPAALLFEVVTRCPSGALHALLSAGEAEQPRRPTSITPLPNGPLAIRGDLSISTPQGEQQEVRATLCRCGASGNKPFCDGTHVRIGWQG